MRFILEALKGAMIGIANVIPGVSGGTMAVVMGIYDKILMAATSIVKDFKASVKTLLPYVIGLLAGVLGFARVLEYLFAHFPVPTAFAFVGLISGAVPMLARNVRGNRAGVGDILAFLGMAAVVVVLPLLQGGGGAERTLSMNLLDMLMLVLLGMIASATMVVPGVSGSMVLMMLGYYQSVLGLVNQLTRAAAAMDWALAGQSLVMLLPFLVGALIGIVLTAKGIRYLLEHHARTTYWGILGLVLASPFAVLYGHSFAILSAGAWLASALALAVGLAVSMLMGKHE